MAICSIEWHPRQRTFSLFTRTQLAIQRDSDQSALDEQLKSDETEIIKAEYVNEPNEKEKTHSRRFFNRFNKERLCSFVWKGITKCSRESETIRGTRGERGAK